MPQITRRRFLEYSAATGATFALSGLANNGSAQAVLNQEVMDFHDEQIIIEGFSPRLSEESASMCINGYKEGRITAFAPGISAGMGAGMGAEGDFYDNPNAASNFATLDNLGYMHQQILTRDDVMLIRKADDLRRAKKGGKIGIIMHCQSPVEYNLDLVYLYKAAGVGIMQLANYSRTPFEPDVPGRGDLGLGNKGITLVRELNKAKMILDVTHTAERTSMDAVRTTGLPVIISNTYAMGKSDRTRSAPDSLLKAVAESGGTIGASLPTRFARDSWLALESYINHIKSLVDLVGIDHVAVGCDYNRGQWYYRLTEGLLRHGFCRDEIRKIRGENILRVMKAVWG